MSRLRTFLAVEVDRKIRDRLVALQETLTRSADGVKWVEAENLHVTLLFLGEVDERELPSLCRAVGRVCAEVEPFPISVETVGVFGSARRPRTIWAGVGAGAEQLVALHAALEAALLELACYRREDRAFTPHITLGRVKGDSASEALPQVLEKLSEWVGGECEVAKVRVMSSDLTPRGPVYGVLSTAKLTG